VEQSTLVAERLCFAIENMNIPHEKSKTSSFVTLTIGVVTIPPDQTTSVDSIVGSADKALYLGKTNGRNRVVRADS
jgi:diguanylate cyclase (GGDEF)-like protein